ncbi:MULTISPECIES: PIG-L deacetylase family protein [unclassified Paraburkholderia]|uniref:PIG-L deacetylase family protein n=1 Tax=unclassified Paraburkholderia TaxID=2615204 RepID=UPI0021592F86|nr:MULTISPECIES: PIG-L family deacetylase [unclassified Paraburkholderia]
MRCPAPDNLHQRMMQSRARLLVVSPHLDDAVLSCGLLLTASPSAIVCTVFTAPPGENMSTDWDRQSGFKDAFEAMQARKQEDAHALEMLGARPVHLPFCDAQYLHTPSRDELAEALRHTLHAYQPENVMVPLGLFHSDHTLVSDACLSLIAGMGDAVLHAYEEIPYRRMEHAVPDRIEELTKRGYLLSPADDLAAAARQSVSHEQMKREAIAAYASQLRAFGPDAETTLCCEEKYWRLQRA